MGRSCPKSYGSRSPSASPFLLNCVTPTSIGNAGAGLYGVVQLNADGTADTSYGTGGLTTIPNPTSGYLDLATVLSSGQVVLVAFGGYFSPTASILSRLNADGTVDAAFGTQNLALTGNSLSVGADGSVVIAGVGSASASYQYLGIQLVRVTSSGHLDQSFGPNGTAQILIPRAAPASDGSAGFVSTSPSSLALTSDGRIVVAATATYYVPGFGSLSSSIALGSQSILAEVRPVNRLAGTNGDYDGDNKSDVAGQLNDFATFGYRASSGTGDVVEGFGASGPFQSISAPGDYDGDGKTDIAAYLPAYGVLAYRPSTGGLDHLTRFGPVGIGTAIPVPGDYDGDGKTDVALFVPGEALYLIDPSGGGAPYAVQFGAAGTGQSIPLPGDYDGSGKTELAVYLPALGEMVYRSPGSTSDTAIPFGPAGPGASLPLVGDYDGDGQDDLAVYLPASGTFAIRPLNGNAPYAVQFGAGNDDSLPISGDFDGDGKDDLAVYIAALDDFAYRPSGGGTDVLQRFGTGGSTIPASALPPILSPGPLLQSLALRSSDPTAGLVFYLPDDLPTTTKPIKPKT